jgi:hypothetical protein
LVPEYSTDFLETLMTLVLSYMRGIWVHSSLKSHIVYVIQSNWEQQLAAATYSAFVVDWATLDCLREDQEKSELRKNWHVPEVDFVWTRNPAKSASENPRSEREEDTEYQRLSSGVYRRNLKIRLTAYRCEVLGNVWKRAHRHTENWMSGLVTIMYKMKPIMLWYSFWSASSPSSSASEDLCGLRTSVDLISPSMGKVTHRFNGFVTTHRFTVVQ